MANTPDIRSLVENFTNELSQVMRRAALEDVHARLALALGDGVPTRRGPGRLRKAATAAPKVATKAKGARRPGRPGRFTPEQLEAMGSKILGLLKQSPGARSEQLTAAMKMDAATLRIPLAALIKAKKIKVKGQKRGTQYFAAGGKS